MSELKYYWLSFCNPKLPRGKRFAGASIVMARDEDSAPEIAWQTKCNPGGEVMIVEIPPTAHANIKEDFIYRLMTYEEINNGDFLIDPTPPSVKY